MECRSNCFRLTCILSFCFILLASCNSGSSNSSVASAGSFEFTQSRVVVSADTSKFIEVEAEVNGVVGSFLIDTGADVFIVSEAFAEQAELPILGQTSISTIAGQSEAQVRGVELFELGNVIGRDLEAVVGFVGSYDGVIGKPFLEHVVLLVNYLEGNVSLADAATTRLAFGEDAQRFDSPNLVLSELESAGINLGSFLLDTGFTGGLLLEQSKIEEFLFEGLETAPAILNTANGEVQGTGFILDELDLGSFRLTNQYVIYQANSVGVGLLGNGVLRQFSLGIDLSRNEVVLELINPRDYSLTRENLRFSGVKIEEVRPQ